jgi:hypothetical protein
MTLVEHVRTRIESEVPSLAGLLEEVADLAALVKEGALPARELAGFVIPLGFDGGAADAAAGLYRQQVEDVIGVVLVAQALGDPAAKGALTTVDALKDLIVEAVAGWAPDSVVGVFVARRGRLVSVVAGTVIYQIEFAVQDQLRIDT